MLFAMQAAPPPVSFSRDIAPIFAMHCNSCHGDAGRLSLRSYADMMRGGSLGRIVIPGDPERSLLLEFIDGRRGGSRRMPQNARRLSGKQIDLVRRWIAEGAKNDGQPPPSLELTRNDVRIFHEKPTRIVCRVPTPAYLMISARDPTDGRVLWSDVASVKTPKEIMDAGEPGEPITWEVRAGTGWPEVVTVQLSILYARGDLRDAELHVRAPD